MGLRRLPGRPLPHRGAERGHHYVLRAHVRGRALAAEIEAVLAESAVIAEGCQACAAGHIAGMVGSSAFCAVGGKHGRLERLLRKVDGVGLLL